MYSIGLLSDPWPCGLGLAQRHKRPGRPMPRARRGRGHRTRVGRRDGALAAMAGAGVHLHVWHRDD
jgi:hypothetical protein